MEQELAEVVDGVGDEGGDAEVIGAGLSLTKVKIGEIDAGKEEE